MPKPIYNAVPDFREKPEEFLELIENLLELVGGLGPDTLGKLDDKNIITPVAIIDQDIIITGTWDFDTHPTGLDHVQIANIGTNTHAEIDTHIADTANPHEVTLAQVAGDSDDITEGSTNLFYTQARQDDIEAFAFAMGT